MNELISVQLGSERREKNPSVIPAKIRNPLFSHFEIAMIKTTSDATAFRTVFSSEQHQSVADAPLAKGGGGAGFDPHELLEAALATCISIIVRKRAAQLNINLAAVNSIVSLNRSFSDIALFEYDVDIQDDIDAMQREQLLDAVAVCPVSQTLTKRIEFRQSRSA